MHKHKKVYLAGPILNSIDEAITWRERVAKENDRLDIHFIDPLELETPDGRAKKDIVRNREEVFNLTDKIVDQDLRVIEDCSSLLAKWDLETVSPGTSMEIMHAYKNGVETILVNEKDWKGESPFIRYFVDHKVNSINSAISIIENEQKN